MIYSVWNQAEKRYDYFANGAKNGKVHAPSPKHIRSGSKLGATAVSSAWRLPTGAKLVGHGDIAKGRVAIAGAQDFGIPLTITQFALLGAAAWLAWKFVGK